MRCSLHMPIIPKDRDLYLTLRAQYAGTLPHQPMQPDGSCATSRRFYLSRPMLWVNQLYFASIVTVVARIQGEAIEDALLAVMLWGHPACGMIWTSIYSV